MKRFGVNVEELSGVKSVTLSLEDKDIIIKNPQVIVMKFQGQKIYQVMGASEEVVKVSEEVVEEVSFSEDDISFVMEQTGASREEAIKALKESGGDIAKAIMLLSKGK